MGNRALVTFRNARASVYLHWNGGPESICNFVEAMKRQGAFGSDVPPSAFPARLCQVVGNFLRGSLSLGVQYGVSDPGDNGIYELDIYGDLAAHYAFRYGDDARYEILDRNYEVDPEWQSELAFHREQLETPREERLTEEAKPMYVWLGPDTALFEVWTAKPVPAESIAEICKRVRYRDCGDTMYSSARMAQLLCNLYADPKAVRILDIEVPHEEHYAAMVRFGKDWAIEEASAEIGEELSEESIVGWIRYLKEQR